MQDFYSGIKIFSQDQGQRQGQDFEIHDQGQDLNFCPGGHLRSMTSSKNYKTALYRGHQT